MAETDTNTETGADTRTDAGASAGTTADATAAPTTETNTANSAAPARRKQNPLLIAFALLIVAGAVGVIVWEEWPEPPSRLPTKGYYTTDDGKTLFIDDAEQLPPFDHGGKPAVRAIVYSCDGGKTQFIGYLQKLPEDALKEAVRKAVAAGRSPKSVDDDDIARESGWLVKKPGAGDWVNSKDRDKFLPIVKVTCPDGRGGTPEVAYPPDTK